MEQVKQDLKKFVLQPYMEAYLNSLGANVEGIEIIEQLIDDGFYDCLINLYVKHFTESELKEVIEFNIKFGNKMQYLMGKAPAIIQEYVEAKLEGLD